jgi:hypothetical protein
MPGSGIGQGAPEVFNIEAGGAGPTQASAQIALTNYYPRQSPETNESLRGPVARQCRHGQHDCGF